MIPTPGHVIKKLYQLMYDFDKLSYKFNIQYWVIAGTLLGAMRHNGIIPWDDDLDVGVPEEYTKIIKSKEFEEELDSYGYKVTKEWFGYKVRLSDPKLEWIAMDIFIMQKEARTWSFKYKKARSIWPKEYIIQNELFPLQRKTFGTFEVTIPAQSAKALDRWFSKWNEKAYQGYNHQKDEPIDPVIEIILDDETRKPALPMTIKRKVCKSDCFPNVFVINCAKHKDRLSEFTAQLGRDCHIHCPIPMRVPCVNGKRLGKTQICQMVDDKELKYQADLTPIEVSISLSHLKAINKFLSRDEPYGIIMEDDVTFKDHFVSSVKQILSNVPDFDVLYLFNNNIYSTRSKLKLVKNINTHVTILQETVPHNPSGVAYIVSRNFAQYLVDNAFPIQDPWDTYLGYSSFRKRFKYYTVNMPERWSSSLVSHPEWTPEQSTQEINTNFKSKKSVSDIEC